MSLPGLAPKTTLPFAPDEFLDKVTKGIIKLPEVAPIIPPREIVVLDKGKINTTGPLPGISYVDKLPSVTVPSYPIMSEVVEGKPNDNLLYILLALTAIGYALS